VAEKRAGDKFSHSNILPLPAERSKKSFPLVEVLGRRRFQDSASGATNSLESGSSDPFIRRPMQ
jgi:hypothetical protein